MLKIFFALSASKADHIILERGYQNLDYFKIIQLLWKESLFMTFGFNLNDPNHGIGVISSEILQKKWASLNGLKGLDSWQETVLAKQIESFQPDVLYTNDLKFFTSQRIKNLPKVKLLALWKASPLGDEPLHHFDLGLSYSRLYLDMLKARGLQNTEIKQFCFDSSVRDEYRGIQSRYDLTFAGSYHWMFTKRNHLLNHIAKNFLFTKKIRYFLQVPTRFKIPKIPWYLNLINRPPVYLKSYLEVIAASKITFNHHSDIAGVYKGNMRIFETLGLGKFLLTDEGDYPEHFIPGEDFVTYRDKADLDKKIVYYLNNSKERDKIANQGYQKLIDNYGLIPSGEELQRLFSKYLV